MFEILKSIILGIVQGLTEFLPVSSSGHLEIAKYILGDTAVGEESLLMTVVLHFGTAFSTLFVFRKWIMDIVMGLFNPKDKESKSFAGKIIVSMIPAALVGVFFNDLIESFFSNRLGLVCFCLLITSALLYLANRAKPTSTDVSFTNALIIGVSQAIAILPGISRSGATISTAALLGIDKEKAASFSFLMVVPLIFGKIAKDVLGGDFTDGDTQLLPLIVGFITSFGVGIAACTYMIKIVKTSKLAYFSYYCAFVGVFGLIYWYFIH